MPLGLSTLYLVIQKKGFESVISLLADPMAEQVGFFEIVDNGSLKLTGAMTKVLAEYSQTGFEFTVHSPYEGLNIASADPAKRRASVRAVSESLDRASSFEALNVVVHPGTADLGAAPEAAFEANSESLMELWDHSCSLGQHMAVENDIAHDKGILVRPDDFRRFFTRIGARLPLVLDVGHANISGTLGDFVGTMASDLAELHVHDNQGEWDQHMAIGTGTVDFPRIKGLFRNPSMLFTVESVHDALGSFVKLAALRREALLI